MKIKENQMREKYLYFVKELKMLWNMWMTVVPTVIGALGTVLKGLEERLEELENRGRIEAV